MTALAAAICVVVMGQVLYHVIARGGTGTGSAFELVLVAYVAGGALVLLGGLLAGQISAGTLLSRHNLYRGLALGVAVALVELGYVFAYRNGLSIATGALTMLTLTTLALAPIGWLFFGELFRWQTLLGGLCACVGVRLMALP